MKVNSSKQVKDFRSSAKWQKALANVQYYTRLVREGRKSLDKAEKAVLKFSPLKAWDVVRIAKDEYNPECECLVWECWWKEGFRYDFYTFTLRQGSPGLVTMYQEQRIDPVSMDQVTKTGEFWESGIKYDTERVGDEPRTPVTIPVSLKQRLKNEEDAEKAAEERRKKVMIPGVYVEMDF